MEVSTSGSIVVCYHFPCVDGIFSALSAHLHFEGTSADVRFQPLTVYTKLSPDDMNLLGDETVYMLDFTGPPGFAIQLAQRCREVIVLDHHKTAMEDIGPAERRPANLKVTFDMERSGATIARDHFQPSLDESVDKMVRMVEDGDLWRWKIADSKPFYAGLSATELNFDWTENPGIFDTLIALDVAAIVDAGKTIQREQDLQIKARLEDSFEISFEEVDPTWGSCMAVRADGLQHLRSEIGNQLAQKSVTAGLRGISCVAYVEPAMGDAEKIKLSFRGVGDEETTHITRLFGGGGHAKASSCIVGVDVFEGMRRAGRSKRQKTESSS